MPLSVEILQQFPASIFFETGTHHGDGVQCALESNFELIYSVEKDPVSYGFCVHRFEGNRNRVCLELGDSRDFLARVLPSITTKATFWLDAHSCEAPLPEGNDDPLLRELALIAEHPLKMHNILIDDIRNLGTPRLKGTLEEVQRALARINPAYRVQLIHSVDFPFDILTATL